MPKDPNPEVRPDLLYTKIPGDVDILEPERLLVEKYQGFSAEILRLSLLGIAVIGFIYKDVPTTLSTESKQLAAFGAICFGVSTVASLGFRYFSSEALRYLVWGLRWFHAKDNDNQEKAKACLKERERRIGICIVCKLLSAIFLGLGSVLLSVAFIWPLL